MYIELQTDNLEALTRLLVEQLASEEFAEISVHKRDSLYVLIISRGREEVSPTGIT